MDDDDNREIEPRFMNLSVRLSKQEPHDRSVLLVKFTNTLESSCMIILCFSREIAV